jgi:hypothetical protein
MRSTSVVANTLPASVAARQTYTATISAQRFDHATEGGGLDVQFDPSVVQVTSVTVDRTTWEFYANDGTIDNTHGQIQNILFASFEARSGSFPIATVSFQAVASGSPQWKLAESAINPFASAGQRLSVAIR